MRCETENSGVGAPPMYPPAITTLSEAVPSSWKGAVPAALRVTTAGISGGSDPMPGIQVGEMCQCRHRVVHGDFLVAGF